MLSNQFIFKSKRENYGGRDLVKILEEIDHEKNIRINKRTSPFKPVIFRYPTIKLSTIQRYYKQWIDLGRPTTFVIPDRRKNNGKFKALPDQIEIQIQNQIVRMSEQEKLVSYQIISTVARTYKGCLCVKQIKKFNASDGWVRSFIKRMGLSSQAVSTRSSSRTHRNPNDHKQEVEQYKNKLNEFVIKHGDDKVFNFDETSFSQITRRIQTIVPKNSRSQPRSMPTMVNDGMSIGCLIRSDGQKLPSILVTKGLTVRSLRKYISDIIPRCILTQSPSGWFCQSQMIIVLETISDHMKGEPCLCVWDAYKSHWTPKITDLAKQLNISLLQVPKGMTSQLQPLDISYNIINQK